MTKKRPTMKDVAQHAGVSTATVSLVVRGSPQIPEETAERVRTAMSDLGYVYNRLAGSLRGGANPTFGLMVTNPRNPYFAELIMAVERSLVDTDEMVATTFSLGGARREQIMATKLAGQGVSGLILMPSIEYTDEQLEAMTRTLGIPVVMLIHPSAPHHDSVLIDDRAAGELLGGHLAGLGVRSIAFVGGFADRLNARRRVAGLRAALPGVVLTELLDTSRGYELTSGGQITDALLSGPGPLPDAIVCFNDAYAVGTYASLRRAGLEPGRDIAVASFDDTPIAEELGVPLTTVDTHPVQIGLAALDTLRRRIADPNAPAQVTIVSPDLVVRDSTTLWQEARRHA